MFYRNIFIYFMSVDVDTELHIVDTDAKFNSACFLVGESALDVWEAFMCIWVSPYSNHPDIISSDQGPQFKSLEWKDLLSNSSMKYHASGVVIHNALGSVGDTIRSYIAYKTTCARLTQLSHHVIPCNRL